MGTKITNLGSELLQLPLPLLGTLIPDDSVIVDQELAAVEVYLAPFAKAGAAFSLVPTEGYMLGPADTSGPAVLYKPIDLYVDNVDGYNTSDGGEDDPFLTLEWALAQIPLWSRARVRIFLAATGVPYQLPPVDTHLGAGGSIAIIAANDSRSTSLDLVAGAGSTTKTVEGPVVWATDVWAGYHVLVPATGERCMVLGNDGTTLRLNCSLSAIPVSVELSLPAVELEIGDVMGIGAGFVGQGLSGVNAPDTAAVNLYNLCIVTPPTGASIIASRFGLYGCEFSSPNVVLQSGLSAAAELSAGIDGSESAEAPFLDDLAPSETAWKGYGASIRGVVLHSTGLILVGYWVVKNISQFAGCTLSLSPCRFGSLTVAASEGGGTDLTIRSNNPVHTEITSLEVRDPGTVFRGAQLDVGSIAARRGAEVGLSLDCNITGTGTGIQAKTGARVTFEAAELSFTGPATTDTEVVVPDAANLTGTLASYTAAGSFLGAGDRTVIQRIA